MLSKARFERLGKFYSIEFFDSDGDRVRDQDERLEICFASVPSLSYSDYSGSIAYKSNIEYIEKESSLDFIDVGSHSYGHNQVALSLVGSNYAQSKEILDGLESYPIIDESLWSELEWNAATEAWNDYGYREFLSTFTDYLDGLPKLSKGKAWKVWTELNTSGEYYLNELGDSIYFPFDSVERSYKATEESLANAVWQALDFPQVSTPLLCPIDTASLPFKQLELRVA